MLTHAQGSSTAFQQSKSFRVSSTWEVQILPNSSPTWARDPDLLPQWAASWDLGRSNRAKEMTKQSATLAQVLQALKRTHWNRDESVSGHWLPIRLNAGLSTLASWKQTQAVNESHPYNRLSHASGKSQTLGSLVVFYSISMHLSSARLIETFSNHPTESDKVQEQQSHRDEFNINRFYRKVLLNRGFNWYMFNHAHNHIHVKCAAGLQTHFGSQRYMQKRSLFWPETTVGGIHF